jgi:hypothetical protein
MSVVAFLSGTGTDTRGFTLEQVLQQSDAWLEQDHNYIQWLFPLLDESQQVHDAPVLTEADVETLQQSEVAQADQQRAVHRMLQFYRDKEHWLTSMDHNHLRITRMIKSIRLLQSLEAAEDIYNTLMDEVHQAGNPISPKNIAFWTDAVGLSYEGK